MALNPYAHFLAGQNPRPVLSASPRLVPQAVCPLTPEQIAAPIAPPVDGKAKWSPCHIVAHLADCELVHIF